VPGKLGKDARAAVKWRMGLTNGGGSTVEGVSIDDLQDDAADADGDAAKATQQQRKRVGKRAVYDAAMWSSLAGIANRLEKDAHPELARLFRIVVDTPYDKEKDELYSCYRELLCQVCLMCSATRQLY
jgi:hypothetical protein